MLWRNWKVAITSPILGEVGENGGRAGPALSAHSGQEKPLRDVNQGQGMARFVSVPKTTSNQETTWVGLFPSPHNFLPFYM